MGHTETTVLPTKPFAIASVLSCIVILLLLPKIYAIFSLLPLLYILVAKAEVSASSGIVVLIVWCLWQSIFTMPLWYFFGLDIRVLFYVPIIVLLMRRSEHHNFVSYYIVLYFLDPPLLFAGRIINFFGGRMLVPFISEVDENIFISSLPFESDVDDLVQKYKIGAVVNMCIEYCGPNYPKEIIQLRLPTVDTAAPSLEAVEKGVEFIDSQLAKGKRVLIHCKGGRGRAGTMALCYFMKKYPKREPKELVSWMKEKRGVIVPYIATYEVVRQFHLKYCS